MALAIIGGEPARFEPFAELHAGGGGRGRRTPPRRSASTRTASSPPDSQQAADIAFPAFARMMDRIGRERGWPPMSRAAFEASRRTRGANFVGSPAEVVEKILYQHEIFGHDRFLLQFSVGTLPHADVMRSIELFGTEVAPVVRRELRTSPAP